MSGSTCPACRGGELEVFFEAFGVPVFCNVLTPTREGALAAPVGDLRLGFCRACALIHNVAFDPERVAYSPDYEASLHFSPLFADYSRDLVARLIERFELRGKTVVDIGCGKGEFLTLLCEAGDNRGIGYDSSYGPRGGAESSGPVRFVRDDFSAAQFEGSVDLICCRHVLEHIAEPRTFLEEVRAAAISSGAPVFFEVPNALFTLRDLGIWDLIYEHCSYFTSVPLQRLFEEVGLLPTSIASAFGDQFLCLEASSGPGSDRMPPVAAEEIAAVAGLVERFEEHFAAKLGRWNDALDHYASTGARVALWGAGSKGITFLNTVEGGARVAAVLDLNPRKHGRYVAGTAQVVESPESLTERPADVVLVANPIYREEIGQHCSQMGLSPELVIL